MIKSSEILNIDSFDPQQVDLSFLSQVQDAIPQEGFMDSAMAEQLATRTLHAAEKCDDLLGQAVLLLSHRDAERRSTKSTIIAKLLSQKAPVTIIKDLYDNDPDYVVVINKYNIALAWHTWLGNKRDTLLKTHHWCKDLVKKSDGTFKNANWSASQEVDLVNNEDDNIKQSWKV
jgi:hypothetical protein